MSDRETLEDMLDQKHLLSNERAAIRAVLKALVEQKKATAESDRASLAYAPENQKLIAANERHRAQVKALRDENEFHADKAKALLVSFDAALAEVGHSREMLLDDASPKLLIDNIELALKGEK